MTDDNGELKNYLDEEDRLKEWPDKRNKGKSQQLVLEYLTQVASYNYRGLLSLLIVNC